MRSSSGEEGKRAGKDAEVVQPCQDVAAGPWAARRDRPHARLLPCPAGCLLLMVLKAGEATSDICQCEIPELLIQVLVEVSEGGIGADLISVTTAVTLLGMHAKTL